MKKETRINKDNNSILILTLIAFCIGMITISFFLHTETDSSYLLSLKKRSQDQHDLKDSSYLVKPISYSPSDNRIKLVSLQNLPLPYSSSSSRDSNLTNIFDQVENSVVRIRSEGANPISDKIANKSPKESQAFRLGSGFIYDNYGHIITNNHVIGTARSVNVTFVDGNVYNAKVIGNDSFSDIAVLQITDDSSGEYITALPTANSSKLEVGQQVIAIGNPFGLSSTMTTGIVSGIGRLLPNPDTGFSIPSVIQTDAPINPGNSGGPLLNIQGQVIGMNIAILSSSGTFSGLGFAIPSNTIDRIVPILIQKGEYKHPWLGISGGSITPDLAQRTGLSRNFKGIVVASVQADSPADKAGVRGLYTSVKISGSKIGDIITGINGIPVKRIDDIINYVESKTNVGDSVKLTINRNARTIYLDIPLQSRPTILQKHDISQLQQEPRNPSSPDSSTDPLGNLYKKCTRVLGKLLCDPLFGKNRG